MIVSKSLTISIVSHGQFYLLLPLLKNLKESEQFYKIILTINIPEKIIQPKWLKEISIFWIFNDKVKGFAENHNYAFKYCESELFLVLNPDIRINKNVLKNLIDLKAKEKIDILGPSILDPNKKKSINSRKFPNIFYPVLKLLYMTKKEYYYKKTDKILYTDWIGGMFLLISTEHYKKINGFDTDFFLYCEDVDFCKRASEKGLTIGQARKISVTHFAQRNSHKKIKYFLYHLRSYFTYLKKHII